MIGSKELEILTTKGFFAHLTLIIIMHSVHDVNEQRWTTTKRKKTKKNKKILVLERRAKNNKM